MADALGTIIYVRGQMSRPTSIGGLWTVENVVATYEYDAYGNLQASSGTEANNNPFRFSTKYFDVTAGFYDYGFRFYDAVTGRWLSRDPIGEDGGLNLYAFVGNGPVNAWDEYGLDWFDNATNFATGMGDGTSFGITNVLREKTGLNVTVNRNDPWYKAGDFTSYITAAGRGLVVKGGVKLGAKAAGKAGAKAVAKIYINCADSSLKNMRGKSLSEVSRELTKLGFRGRNVSKGGYRTYETFKW